MKKSIFFQIKKSIFVAILKTLDIESEYCFFFTFKTLFLIWKYCQREEIDHFSLETKEFLIAEKEKHPTIGTRQLTTDLFLKFNLKTSKSVACWTLKAKKDLKEIKMDSKAFKNRKYMMNKGRLEFEKVLERNLRTKFVKKRLQFKNLIRKISKR